MGHLLVSRCALYLPVPGGLALRPRARPAHRGRGRRCSRPRRRAAVLDGAAEADGGGRPAAGADPASASCATRMALAVPAGPRGADRGLPGRRRAAVRRALHRGGPRVRADPGPAGDGRPGDRPPAPHQPGEAAPGPRDADRARDPAQPLPAVAGPPSPASRWRRRAALLRGGRRPLRRHPAATAAAWRWPSPTSRARARRPASSWPPCTPRCARWPAPRRPPVLMARLNRFLYESTQANRYVTLFYARARPGAAAASRTSTPGTSRPSACGAERRRRAPGRGRPRARPARRGAASSAGRSCSRPGDVLAMVTDGATEALSPGRRGVRRRARRGRARRRPSARRARDARCSRLLTTVERLDGRRGLHRRPDRAAS